jgi:hypothetical protein
MKKLLFKASAILSIALLFSSCRKNDSLTKQEDTFDYVKSTNQSASQVFTVNGATGGTITGQRGTKITFPPNAFVEANNAVVTQDVIVRLQESLSKNNWIMDGLSATTQAGPLLSGGMLNIEAMRKDNGAELFVAPAMRVPAANVNNLAGKIVVQVPRIAAQLDQQELFLPDTPRIVQPGGPVPDPVSANGLPVLAWQNSTYYPFGNGPNSYIFQLPKFKWANCDQLMNVVGPKTTITVTPVMTKFAGATGIQAMLVYASTIRSVITLVPNANGTHKSYNNSIPMSQATDVVLIGKAADGKILFKKTSVTSFTANQNISIEPEIVSGTTIQAYLDSIN